ncbi:hypothetical protein D516_4231 [Rhodobacter sp. AKP1]|nr:hypothetical protein D516_4231 [Rhodobacter sp. AKP1]
MDGIVVPADGAKGLHPIGGHGEIERYRQIAPRIEFMSQRSRRKSLIKKTELQMRAQPGVEPIGSRIPRALFPNRTFFPPPKESARSAAKGAYLSRSDPAPICRWAFPQAGRGLLRLKAAWDEKLYSVRRRRHGPDGRCTSGGLHGGCGDLARQDAAARDLG